MDLLGGLLELADLTIDNVASLLLDQHHLEPIEISHTGTSRTLSLLLGPWGGLPLGLQIEFLDSLQESLACSRTSDRNDQVGQVHAAEGEDLARNSGSGTFNEGAGLVENINDDDGLAGL